MKSDYGIDLMGLEKYHKAWGKLQKKESNFPLKSLLFSFLCFKKNEQTSIAYLIRDVPKTADN